MRAPLQQACEPAPRQPSAGLPPLHPRTPAGRLRFVHKGYPMWHCSQFQWHRRQDLIFKPVAHPLSANHACAGAGQQPHAAPAADASSGQLSACCMLQPTPATGLRSFLDVSSTFSHCLLPLYPPLGCIAGGITLEDLESLLMEVAEYISQQPEVRWHMGRRPALCGPAKVLA